MGWVWWRWVDGMEKFMLKLTSASLRVEVEARADLGKKVCLQNKLFDTITS